MSNLRSTLSLLTLALTSVALPSLGCSGDPVHTDAPPTSPVVALLQGPAAAPTAEAIRQQHDAVFAGPRLRTSHHGSHAATVALAPPPAGTAPQLLLVEELDSDAAAADFADDPAVAALFASAPEVTVLTVQSDWEHWGGSAPLGAGAGGARYFVPIRGSLAGAPDAARTTHDGFFSAGRPSFEPAGYERHHAYTVRGAAGQLEMLGVWNNLEHLQAAATSPMFGTFLNSLFAAPPTVTVFTTTDWVSWASP
jgi:hypothetical protein